MILRALGGLRGVGVWTAGAGAANANLRNGDRRVGLKAGVCLTGLAAMIGHARRVSRHVTVKIVTLHVRAEHTWHISDLLLTNIRARVSSGAPLPVR